LAKKKEGREGANFGEGVGGGGRRKSNLREKGMLAKEEGSTPQKGAGNPSAPIVCGKGGRKGEQRELLHVEERKNEVL